MSAQSRARSTKRNAVLSDPKARAEWTELGGDELCCAFGGTRPLDQRPVALLDAAWLVQHAKGRGPEWLFMPIISSREELPAEAFVSYADLSSDGCLPSFPASLPFVMVSSAWLTTQHPDPCGHQLKLIACVLEKMIAFYQRRRIGVFWAYPCLLARKEDAHLSRSLNRLHDEGLRSMATIYSHARTWVLRVTRQPVEYPAAYAALLPRPPDELTKVGVNATAGTAAREPSEAPSSDSCGWSFAEACWARLTTPAALLLDLGPLRVGASDPDVSGVSAWARQASFLEVQEKCTAGMTGGLTGGGTLGPPLSPAAFAEAVEARRFARAGRSRESDLALVVALYADTFEQRMREATELQFTGLGWGDDEVLSLTRVLSALERLENLETLRLDGNRFGEAGEAALCELIQTDALMPALHFVFVDDYRRCEARMRKLRSAETRAIEAEAEARGKRAAERERESGRQKATAAATVKVEEMVAASSSERGHLMKQVPVDEIQWMIKKEGERILEEQVLAARDEAQAHTAAEVSRLELLRHPRLFFVDGRALSHMHWRVA